MILWQTEELSQVDHLDMDQGSIEMQKFQGEQCGSSGRNQRRCTYTSIINSNIYLQLTGY